MLAKSRCSLLHHLKIQIIGSRCPVGICVITVVILLSILPVMTDGLAQKDIKNHSSSLIQMGSHYLPTETETELQQSPRLLPVTKAASKSGTRITSTVRPWPSHSFFRSVLARSDNVVPRKRYRSKSKRKSNETGILAQNNSSTLHLEDQTEELQANKSETAKLRKHRKRQDSKADNNVTVLPEANYDSTSSNSNNTRARSVTLITHSLGNQSQNANSSTGSTQRNFSSPQRKEKSRMQMTPQLVPTEANGIGVNPQVANVTLPSQAKDFLLNGVDENSNNNESSSRINSPQVGFQYEILLPPPPLFPPRPTLLPKLTASLNHKPSSTAISTVLQHVSHFDSSGEGGYSSDVDDDDDDDASAASKNNRNTSNYTILPVNTNDMEKKKVTNDDASTTIATTTTTPSPPLPLGSQLEGNKNAEAAAASSIKLPLLLSPGSYNKSNKIILQDPQYPSAPPLLLPSPPPTQPLQLDTRLVKGNSAERATYSNKSHLPQQQQHSLSGGDLGIASSETHAEIKKNDPWTINHNSGIANDASTNKETLGEISTFHAILKRDRKQNSSSVNTLPGAGFPTTTFPSFTTTAPSPVTFAAWKAQPTHFSFLSKLPAALASKSGKVSTGERTENRNKENTFQKRISQQQSNDNQKEITTFANANYPVIHSQEPVMKSQTALINRRNMFTVVRGGPVNPKIRVESSNRTTTAARITTTSKAGLNVKSDGIMESSFAENLSDDLLYNRADQVEKPLLTTSILAGPDRMMMVSPKPGYTEKADNDYFDEDDAQANLHHWIESEQGHFVTPSTELPRFTNLTWPYYIPNADSGNSEKVGTASGTSGTADRIGSPASTALSVSFNGQRKENVDFNGKFEFYIPSAAADPKQNPILLSKKPTNKTGPVTTTSLYESWTRVPTISAATSVQPGEYVVKQGESHLKQSDHKSKIKHNHWGSKGLSSVKPANSVKVKPPPTSSNNIKVFESSTGSPKSTPSVYPFATFTKPPGATTFNIIANKQNQNHFVSVTSPSSSNLGSTWPFGGANPAELLGQSETASFVTAKTPTNIWYKPIINHYTASLPFLANASLLDSINGQIFKNSEKTVDGILLTSTMQPELPSSTRQEETWNVGGSGGGDDDGAVYNDNTFPFRTDGKNKTSLPGKLSPASSRRNATTLPERNSNDRHNPILFKVWNFVDGKLKLENQREIPAWALQGYLIPASGTILNLQQIPPALQPLVTSAMAMNKEGDIPTGPESLSSSTPSYFWKPLPIRGSISTTMPTTISVATPTSPDESLFGNNDSNQIKMAANKMGWHEAETSETMQSSSSSTTSKQPISINYVLWNNPASIYGQSIILSTPNPQTLLSHQPTPLSYFPSSTITPVVENAPQFTIPYVVTIKNPSGSSGGGGSDSSSHVTTTTPRTTSSSVDQEKLELLFQNYFQYFITSTPAPTTTTTTTPTPISLANKVADTYGQDNSQAWKDLKDLILRLANTKSNNNDNKASITLDKDKSTDLDYLGNVAAIALIMSYLRNQYEKGSSTASSTTTPAPYGVTDDMTPPNKDQLWATVYPLFQHFLNNPNYTFIPPPSPPLKSSNQQLLSESTSGMGSMTPTSPSPILFTEPQQSVTGSSNYFSQNTEYNHYASYYPTITTTTATTPSTSSVSHLSITKIPRHGATTFKSGRSSEEEQYADLDYLADDDSTNSDLETTTQKSRLFLIKKLKKKKKKDPLKKAATALVGAALLKKISAPLFGVVKKPKKYWLDLEFKVDFLDLLKKKLLFMLAYKYMPVALVLAFGVAPIILSLVPLLYKWLWIKYKNQKKKHIHHKFIKIPIPYPKPVPVPVFHRPPRPPPPPYIYGRHHASFLPPDERFHQRPAIRFENGHEQHHNNDDVIHIDSPVQPPPPMILDHHYAAAPSEPVVTSLENGIEKPGTYPYRQKEGENEGDFPGMVNSFNYDYVKHSTPHNTHATSYPHNPNEDHEIHVHLYDDESQHHPQFQAAPAAPTPYSPSSGYTSYTEKDLQPYPVTKGYEMGYDFGKTLAGITNKHDMEIFKILMESKREKLNKLLEMWNLAKYGAAVASDAAMNTVNVIRGSTTTPSYKEAKPAKKKKKRKRRKRRKKRKHSGDDSIPH